MGIAFSPDSGKSWDAACRDPEICTRSDQDFFESSHILNCAESLPLAVRRKTAQIEDRICDQLARSMESHVTAAIAFEDFDTALGELFGRSENVFRFGVSSQRNHWRVLQQQKNVADGAIFPQVDQPLLQLQTSGVIHNVELDD